MTVATALLSRPSSMPTNADVDVGRRLALLATYLGHYAGDPVKRAERKRVRRGSWRMR